jgi:hypothetical protein
MRGSLLARFSRAMEKSDWKHTVDVDKSLIICFIGDDSVCLVVRISVAELTHEVVLSICFERRCWAKWRPIMREYANSANWKETFGFFAVSDRDGEVKYRYAVNLSGVRVTAGFVDSFLNAGVSAVKRHYDNIQLILSGKWSKAVGSRDIGCCLLV